MQRTKYDWQYSLEKSEKASLSIPNGCSWPRGKMLGGTSALNAMMYVRGNRLDYDDWYDAGNPGWAFRNVFKYFKKSEDNKLGYEKEFQAFHGTGGPLKIDMMFGFDPIKDVVIEAVKEMGGTIVPNCNGEDQMGFTYLEATIDHGHRQSAATAFLTPIVNRTNLHVVKHAHVTDVIINKKGSAEGINLLINDKKVKVSARKEVILSAGTIGSPQILMNSGIGPKKHLEEIGIKVKKDLAVGKNLQDHTVVILPIKLHKTHAQPLPESDIIDDIYMYLMHGVGSLSHMGLADLTGFVNTQNKSSERPDVQYFYFQFRINEDKRLETFLDNIGFEDKVRESLLSGIKKEELLLVYVSLLQPKSVGKIELNSKDPLDKPKIFGNYLEDQEDVNTLIRGVNVMKRLINTKHAKQHEFELLRVNIPGCAHIEFDKPGYWECYVRHMTATVYNPTSTCKMGPDSDTEAVVDARLKVKGIKGLRVVDASIMPKIISGNTMAPVIMIAEKAADMIKEDWTEVHSEL